MLIWLHSRPEGYRHAFGAVKIIWTNNKFDGLPKSINSSSNGHLTNWDFD